MVYEDYYFQVERRAEGTYYAWVAGREGVLGPFKTATAAGAAAKRSIHGCYVVNRTPHSGREPVAGCASRKSEREDIRLGAYLGSRFAPDENLENLRIMEHYRFLGKVLYALRRTPNLLIFIYLLALYETVKENGPL